MNSIITLAGRRKMAEARAGVNGLPPIAFMAVGDGGTEPDGTVKEPADALNSELIRKAVDKPIKMSDTCYRYKLTLDKGELTGKAISEMALIDADGDAVAIKNFLKKPKDEDMEMDFEIDDNF